MANYLPPFPSFDYETDKANVAVRWDKWVKHDERKRALLLHYAGEQVHEIYKAEKQTDTGTSNAYEKTRTVLDKYVRPNKNTQMKMYTFRSCKQKEWQTLDE